MSATGHCPECGSELPPGAPEGLCPACLLRAGIEQPASGGSSADPAVDPTAVSPPESRFVPPSSEELAERFPHLEILELLGQGGMGAVYKARQPQLDRFVALKILPPELGRDPTFSERFSREARALAQLSHPHIVTVYDYGRAGDLCYFVMEYVDGTNLRQVIDAGAMQPAEALAIIPQICTALEYAHQEGIVHRDIKPENILLDKRGRVKIADFGLSKLIGDVPPDVSLTGTHQVMGTLRYMAPEQMQGTKGVDHRADIYSLGVVFYELLTGEVPMGRFAPPSRKVEVDVRLDEIVLRALEQEPAKRYQRASDVKTDLESLDSGAPPVTAAPSEEPPGEGPWMTVAGTASTAVSAAILVGAGLILFLHGGEIFDEVSGALRLGVEVRNVAIGLLQVAGALMLLMGSVTVFGGWPDGVWATILLLMGYLMWYVASPWVLAGLALPWFALGYFEARDRDGWPVTLCVPVTLGLIVYGMLLSQSFWPLLGLLSVAAGFFAAHCVLALKELDAGDGEVVERASEAAARGRGEGGSDLPSGAAVGSSVLLAPWEFETIRRQLRGPAIALMLMGLLAFAYAGFVLWAGGYELIRQGIDRESWDDYLGELVVLLVAMGVALFGAVLMRGGWHMLALQRLRPALLAAWLGQPVGIWALIVLSRPDVRTAFGMGVREPRPPSSLA